MSNMYYNGTIEIDTEEIYAEVEVRAKASGWYSEGVPSYAGCPEPPDGDFQIDDVEYVSAKSCDEQGNTFPIEITDELKKLVDEKLNQVEFEYDEYEPDCDDYWG